MIEIKRISRNVRRKLITAECSVYTHNIHKVKTVKCHCIMC